MANENEQEEVINHRELMEEEKLELKDLPKEIQKQIKDFNDKLKNYEQTDDEDEENDLFLELQQDDVNIADSIQTWVEDNNSEDDNEVDNEEEEEQQNQNNNARGNKGGNNNNSQRPQASQQQKPLANNQVGNGTAVADNVQQNVQAQPVQQTEKTLEQKIREGLKDNVISVEDLESLIGGEAGYPEHREGSLLLRKQYLKPFYEVKG